jgi:hypothetical protein
VEEHTWIGSCALRLEELLNARESLSRIVRRQHRSRFATRLPTELWLMHTHPTRSSARDGHAVLEESTHGGLPATEIT